MLRYQCQRSVGSPIIDRNPATRRQRGRRESEELERQSRKETAARAAPTSRQTQTEHSQPNGDGRRQRKPRYSVYITEQQQYTISACGAGGAVNRTRSARRSAARAIIRKTCRAPGRAGRGRGRPAPTAGLGGGGGGGGITGRRLPPDITIWAAGARRTAEAPQPAAPSRLAVRWRRSGAGSRPALVT